MGKKKTPGWLRSFNILFGIITVLLSLVVLANPGFSLMIYLVILALALIITGIARFTVGMFADISESRSALNMVVGLISFVLAFFIFVYPGVTTQIIIYLLSFYLLITGFTRVLIGWSAEKFSTGLRVLWILVGFITLGISFGIFILPELGSLYLVMMIAVAFVLNGLNRIIFGITGVK